jgi:hypothetical protein
VIGRESVNWGLDRQRKFLENAAEQFVVGLPCRGLLPVRRERSEPSTNNGR